MRADIQLTGSELLQLCQWHANVPDGTDLSTVNFLYIADFDTGEYSLVSIASDHFANILIDYENELGKPTLQELTDLVIDRKCTKNENLEDFNALCLYLLSNTLSYRNWLEFSDKNDCFHALLVFKDDEIRPVMLPTPVHAAYTPKEVKYYALNLATMFRATPKTQILLS